MTFGEKRKALRRFRMLASALRERVNSYGLLHRVDGLTLSLPSKDYDAMTFGMATMKAWLPERDAEQEVIPGSGRLVRMNFLYRKTGEDREHLLFKGIPVFRETA